MANTIAVSILADVRELQSNLAHAEGSVQQFGDTAERESRSASEHLEGIGDASDAVASKGSQAAGAMSGLGDVLSTLHGPLGAVGKGMLVLGPGMQFAADAGDLMNAAIEGGGAAIGKMVTFVKNLNIVQTAQNLITKAVAISQAALNAVMDANPIALLVIAIGALVAAFIVAYKKSDTFRAIVNGAFNAVKTAINTVLNNIVPAIRKAFETISKVITTVTGAIKTAVSATFNGIKTAVTTPINAIVSFIKGVPANIAGLAGKFKSAGSGLMSAFINGIKTAANFIGNIASSIGDALKNFINTQVIDRINNALDFNISVLGKHIHISAPDIPHLANGGITNGPTLALIGDNPGGREAVVPLDKYDLNGQSTNVYVTVNAPIGSNPTEIGRSIYNVLKPYMQVSGSRLPA